MLSMTSGRENPLIALSTIGELPVILNECEGSLKQKMLCHAILSDGLMIVYRDEKL